MTDLSPNAAVELSGQPALRDLRRSAAESFAERGLPTTDEEIWRYSRIGELRLDEVSLVSVPSGMTAGGVLAETDGIVRSELCGRVLVIDGHLVDVELDADVASVITVSDAATDAAALGLLGAAMGEAVDAFAALNTAFCPSPVVVEVAAGAVVPRPLLVDVRCATDAALVLPRLVVVAGELAEVTVVERHRSAEVRSVSVPVTELVARPGAQLRHLAVQQLEQTVWQIGSLVAVVERDARVETTSAGLGGDYARQRIDARMVAANGSASIAAVYFGEGDQTLDFRTSQDHLAGHTRSDLLFKGAVAGRSHSVYTGNIHIAKTAGDVDAFQTNRTIKLSDEAWAESVPNLEIENNDVRCSHASAIGPIDIDQRFYLESRGVPPQVAERLVVLGFFDEVLDRVALPSLAASLRVGLADRLEQVEVVS